MPWPCRMIEYGPESSGATLQIGDMFFFDPPAGYVPGQEDDPVGWYWPAFFCMGNRLSDYYLQHNSHRKPLLVFLPGRTLFCVDGQCWKQENGQTVYYGGWKVTGEAPLITVEPSILIGGSYHGFLQNGVITDDCEGRKF